MRVLACASALAILAACSSSSGGDPAAPSPGTNDAGTTVDGATRTGSTTPASTAIAARCLDGGAGDVKDGWTRTIGPGSVSAVSGNIGVAIVYSLTIDDELRAARHFAEGVWDRLLGDEYTVTGTRTSGGDDGGLLPFSSGTAVDKATGDTLHITVTASRYDGIAYPVVALAPDEATLAAKLATPEAIDAMRAYNAFPLSCGTAVGKWTTSSTNAVVTYDRGGFFTGIKVSSLQIDVAFDDALHYDWKAQVTDNSGQVSERENGAYTATEQQIDLASTDGKNTTYDAAFVAVKGGIALSITNRQFSGNRWVLYRAE